MHGRKRVTLSAIEDHHMFYHPVHALTLILDPSWIKALSSKKSCLNMTDERKPVKEIDEHFTKPKKGC
jgi:hypothetical protein